jgi:Flp pilus assembly protein TadD
MRQFQEAVASNPNRADAHFDLAVAHAQARQWSLAVQHFKETVRLAPADTQAQRSLEAAQSMLARETGGK